MKFHEYRTLGTVAIALAIQLVPTARAKALTFEQSPYPPSPVIRKITWHWETYQTAAPGSDLWPVTWGPDDHLYTAWGDGGGFGGTDSDGRVSMGFARIEGAPKNFSGININGGKSPQHPATFPKKGKTAGVVFVDGVLYASINLQDGPWPNVNHVLAWSTDRGATWTKADWLFPKGAGSFQPARFVQFGKDYAGVPAALAGYVYLCGSEEDAQRESGNSLYLARVPKDQLRQRAAYQFFRGLDAGKPAWTSKFTLAQPIFSDANGATASGMVYNPAIKRFLLTSYHVGPGQLGVFDAPDPWGPWTTVAYYAHWGEMGDVGEGLTCEFPQKWMSADGLKLWSVFSVYGAGGKQGIHSHDRFNLIKVTLSTTKPSSTILPRHVGSAYQPEAQARNPRMRFAFGVDHPGSRGNIGGFSGNILGRGD
ncbi:MAG: DUF4185 domain-containing protein [Thermoguttaceae bacterium]|jgi:hypothetical protein